MEKKDLLFTTRFYNWVAQNFFKAFPWEDLKHNSAADQLFADEPDRPVSPKPTFVEKRDRIEIEFVRQELNKRFARKTAIHLLLAILVLAGAMTTIHKTATFAHGKYVAYQEKIHAEEKERKRLAAIEKAKAEEIAKAEAAEAARKKWEAEAPLREAARKKEAEEAEKARVARLKKALEQQKIADAERVIKEKMMLTDAAESIKMFYAGLDAGIRKIKVERIYLDKRSATRWNVPELLVIKALSDLGETLPTEFTNVLSELPEGIDKTTVDKVDRFLSLLENDEKTMKKYVEKNIAMDPSVLKNAIKKIRNKKYLMTKDPQMFELQARILYQQGRIK